MTASLKTKEIPAGGIAGFVMTDEQIEQLEAEELQEQYGTTGIAQFSTVGKKMANFGRHGDDTVAHVETGELIVPRALIEKNPELKESIFNHLRELGVEDPERYVVGEVKNSLNPTTGLPESFFKKLFKSVSKIAKGVGKALKKAAPLIIPLALNYFAPGLGQVYSAALGAGIGTLVQGGSVKDALKAAVLGGATGALTAGFSGPNSGIEGFGQNIASDVSMGTANIGDAFSQGSFAPLQSTGLPSLRNLDADPSNNTGVGTETLDTTNMASTSTDGLQQANYLDTPKETAFIDMTKPTGEVTYLDANQTPITSPNIEAGAGSSNMYESMKNLGSKTSDVLFGTDATQSELFAKAGQFQKDALAEGYTLGSKEAMAMAKKELNPGIIRKYGPSLALAGVAGAAGGMFDVPEEEEDDPARTGMDVYNENPDVYNVANLTPTYITGDPSVGSNYPYYVPQAAATGGEIFPRRVGGIMPNEGIPNKDSVRAMLMPGEFVMTTDAVKGLGGGNMNKGINNMYGVMRNLEQRGRAVA
jgi:hypothetical protein